MKIYLLIGMSFWIAFTTFGKRIYTLSKEDFVKQFKESSLSDRIYCQDEKGIKVWFFFNPNSILIAKFKDNSEKKWMLQSTKYVRGQIQAIESNVWISHPKKKHYDLNEIAAFRIEGNHHEPERPYWDIDSVQVLNTTKNDSIRKLYSIGTENVIGFIRKKSRRNDTLLIMENACYNLKFKDRSETTLGVVQKITKDSIWISNGFNLRVAQQHKKEFKIYHFPIRDIREIQLLKTGGYSYQTIHKDDFQMVIWERKKEIENAPLWYSWDSMSGEIGFYRSWLTEGGFTGIQEKEGKTFFYER